MTDAPSDYDVFISYAREDGPWVRDHLHGPLVRCRTVQGHKPRVFMDVSEEGIRPGQNYIEALVAAIRRSRRIIPVYSSTYFRKEMCQWELTKAFQLDPAGTRGLLVPVLIEPAASALVPTYVNVVNWIEVTREDWFDRLATVLQFTPHAPASLRFLDTPPDVVVNHTLPPLRVEVRDDDGRPAQDEKVSVAAEHGALQGTLSVTSVAGIATFGDLSIGAPAVSTHLVATADGCDPVSSDPFTVRAAAMKKRAESDRGAGVASEGDALLVGDDGALILFEPGLLRVIGADGSERARVSVGGRVRWIKRGQGKALVATWDGAFHALSLDGDASSWSIGGAAGRFSIPGDASLDGPDGAIVAGLWNGEVAFLRPGAAPQPILRHAGGVQALAVLGRRLYVCGLDGNLTVYEGDRVVATHAIERTIRLLQPFPDAVVAVGERKLFHASPARAIVLNQPLPIGPARAALGDTSCPIVVDASGAGIRFDKELFITVAFHTAPGAVPVSTDRDGRVCIFANPDGSRTLMREGRIVFTQPRGTLAVSESGGQAALGGGGRIRVVDAATLAPAV